MVIDNRLTTGKIRMLFLVIIGLVLFIIVYCFKEGEFWNHYLLLSFVAILLLVYIFLHLKKLYYFYFNDEKSTIVIRWYYMHPFMRKYKTIQIPVNSLEKYEITESFIGLRKNLILYVQSQKGVAKYPAICISALSAKELNDLEKSLKQILIWKIKK